MDEKLIKACKKGKRIAQRQIYDQIVDLLYNISRRYLKKEQEIEDVLSESFYLIFTKINQLKDHQAFYSWAKRITINQCLHQLKKQNNFNIYLDQISDKELPKQIPDSTLETQDLLELLNHIPEGCKTIFNLFVIEGYSHKDIAKQLGISEGTSKSQLNAAKNKLQKLIYKHYPNQASNN